MKYLGFGLGLRAEHGQHVLDSRPEVDWFELQAGKFMAPGGQRRHYMLALRDRYPMALCDAGLSIGSTEPLDNRYLNQLKALADEIKPQWISDQVAFSRAAGVNSHLPLPLPGTEEALSHVVERIGQVQELLGRKILVENVCSYVVYRDFELAEWDFLNAVAERADCKILLDLGAVLVNAKNHGFDPEDYLAALNVGRVQQIHLSSCTREGDLLIGNPTRPIPKPVYELYQSAVRRFGAVSTVAKREGAPPAFSDLIDELTRARNRASKGLGHPVPKP